MKRKGADSQAPWRLTLVLKAESFRAFFPMLEKGVLLPVQVGSSIKSLLCDQIGLSEGYVEERIQTCFLSGKPVDDLAAAMVSDGATLAFSAAMPGLLGATLRKGSFYAPMRAGITHREQGKGAREQEGRITVKLFNLLIREMGPFLLQRGVWADGEDVQRLLAGQSKPFWAGFLNATLNGREFDKAMLMELEWPRERVFLALKEA